MPYRIISFDGGGVRGAYSARLIARLAQAVPGFIDRSDLLAGTSTGGIIALGLAAGLTSNDLTVLYRDKAKKIFDRSFTRDLAVLHGLRGADYSNKGLLAELTGIFGGKRLKDLHKRVLIPSFQLDNGDPDASRRQWKSKFFHNFPGPDSDGEELAVEVAMRTSAAPVYFPSRGEFIDGGVVANDPSMAALCQSLNQNGAQQALTDVRLFSLGTGRNAVFIQGRDLDWGLAEWARPLVNLMIDGVMGVAEYQCATLLGDHYCRLQPLLPKPIALDDAAVTNELIGYADEVNLSGAVAWLQRNFTN